MLRLCQRNEYLFKILKIGRYSSRVTPERSKEVLWRREIYNGRRPERASHSSMKVARRSIVLLYMDGKSIFIDDQRCGVVTTALLQSLQIDESSIGTGSLPV